MTQLQKKTRFEIPTSYSPARRSISPKKNRPIHHFLFSLLALLFLTSCGPATIWNVPAEDLSGLIALGDTSYLKNLNLSESDLREVLQLEPGAAYFHAHLAREIGREELFAPLLEVEWLDGEKPWKLLAGETLSRYYIETGDYEQAETVASGLLGFDDTARYKFLQVEALYWQKRDTEVLDLLETLGLYDSEDLDDFSRRETALFEAVSSTRLGRPGWKEKLLGLFKNQPPSSLHYRVLRFIENDYEEAFDAEELAFLNAVVAVADSRHDEAVSIFSKLLAERPDLYLTGSVYETAYVAFRYSGAAAMGARFFESLTAADGNLSEAALYPIYENTALLSYFSRDYGKAGEYFQMALDVANDEAQKERMRWYLLRNAYSRSIDRALEVIPALVREYDDPRYYSDMFDLILTRLVDLRRWDEIIDFYDVAADRVATNVRARAAYLNGALLRDGLVSKLPATSYSVEELFGEAVVQDSGYYGLLASATLDVLPGVLNIVEEQVSSLEPSTEDFIVAGFVTYGLLEYAFALVQENPDSVSDRTLLDLSHALAEAGDIYNSIRTIDFLKARPSFQPTREALELSYPRAFRREVEAAAGRDGIPPYLLFALIREESYFKRDIVSRAGAVGLSQLMPATAADTARRMGIDLPPLTDPAGNISIGSYYFAQMLNRFGVGSNAVFAYNAGPTRMRDWNRQYAGLKEDLVLEALPIEETRNHGRKVFVSAVMYAYLYYGIAPAEVLNYYFGFAEEGNKDYESD